MNLNKKILFFLLLFYANFTFGFESIHTLQSLLNLFLAFVIIIMNKQILINRIKVFDKYILFSGLILTLLGVVSIIVPYLFNTMDFTFFRSIFFGTAQKLLLNISAIIIFIRFFKMNATLERYAKYFILTLCFYFTMTLLFIVVTPLKEIWLEILYISELDIRLLNQPRYATRIGIDGFAGFIQTFKFSIGSILSVLMIIYNNVHFKRIPMFYLVTLAITTIGTLLYGRIGSIVSIISIVVLIIFFMTKPKNINKALFVIIGVFLVVTTLGILSISNESIRIWFMWAFELVINFIEEGTFTSTSTNILFERMYFIPDLKSFLFGNGLYTDPTTGAYFMGTDVGFLRAIMFYGIVPTVLMYTAVMIPIIGLFKELKAMMGKQFYQYASILFVMLIIVFEIKGGIYHHYYATLIPFYLIAKNHNRHIVS